uniref:K Homology domain-containing protein n=1 Tax=Opuntia streptacantha TaxID=393608 RepID=A0A7C8ZA53_OPUST
MEREALGANNSGGKRKIEDEIELAKQKAQAIAARILSDADAKRPRTAVEPPPPPSSFSSQPSFPVSYASQTSQYNGVPSSKKIIIPNAKVGVIIGRGGDMIKNLQQRSGARIQITRDADADPTSLTRDVELMGTQEQISRAEELINEVIAETDAASSGSSGNRDVAPLQPGGEQFIMKVPNDRVALVIGKGGETIKSMQGQTGARIQVGD